MRLQPRQRLRAAPGAGPGRPRHAAAGADGGFGLAAREGVVGVDLARVVRQYGRERPAAEVHTEFFTAQFNAPESLMLLVAGRLRVATLTGHVPLREVPERLSAALLKTKLHLLAQSLRSDFGIPKPRLAVLGLNPHAGENGLLGTEEKEILEPVIKEMREKGMLVYGPYPADGFFANGSQCLSQFSLELS